MFPTLKNVAKISYKFIRPTHLITAAMAEWLRRWTRNPMGSPRAGSNPARSVHYVPFCLNW